jgi:hypothetical protein
MCVDVAYSQINPKIRGGVTSQWELVGLSKAAQLLRKWVLETGGFSKLATWLPEIQSHNFLSLFTGLE